MVASRNRTPLVRPGDASRALARTARGESVRVCPALGLGRVPRRGEGKEALRRARHAVSPGDDRRQGEAQEHPPSGTRPSTRGPIRPSAPLRARPASRLDRTRPAPRAKIATKISRPDAVRPVDPVDPPSTRRRPAVAPPDLATSTFLPRSPRRRPARPPARRIAASPRLTCFDATCAGVRPTTSSPRRRARTRRTITTTPTRSPPRRVIHERPRPSRPRLLVARARVCATRAI